MDLGGALVHLELNVGWLATRSGLTNPSPHRRLNAFENLLGGAARPWRGELTPICPERELRLCAQTCEQLLAWIEARETAIGDTRRRLAAYTSPHVIDSAVTPGWVRLLLTVSSDMGGR